MRLRDFQVYAPNEPRERNIRLSVMSEVVVHWIRSGVPISGPIAKLVVAVHATNSTWQGPAWLVRPDHVGELRVTDDRVAQTGNVTLVGCEAMLAGFERARIAGVEVDIDELRRTVIPEARRPGEHSIELPNLSFRDPASRNRYTVWYTFSEEASFIEVRSPGKAGATVVSSREFHSLATFFPVVASRVSGGTVRFLTRSGLVLASSVLSRS